MGDKGAEHDRAKVDDAPSVDVGSELFYKLQGCLVSSPAVLSLGVVEQLVCGRFVEGYACVGGVLCVVEFVLVAR